jgi:hypothetical protein
MTKIIPFPVRKQRKLSSLLCLSLDGTKLEGGVLRRATGSLTFQQPLSVSLSLDPMTADSELVGREIRNHLDAAGIQERFCVLALPLKWALTTQTELPDLPEDDLDEFLKIEAERGFHGDTSTLHYGISRWRDPAGKTHALLAGMPRGQLETLDKLLRAAKLRPVSFTPAIVALQEPLANANEGVLALAVGEGSVSLGIAAGGGITTLRTIDGALENEGGRRVLHADLLARDLRITLGQLPEDLRKTIKSVRVFGPREFAQQLADELELRLESFGLKVDVVTRYRGADYGIALPAEVPVTAAISLGATILAGRKPAFEFLPPRVSPWQQAMAKYSQGRLRMAVGAAGIIFLLVAAIFLFQEWQLVHYRTKWNAMAGKVKELAAVQQQIHQYRPWFDETFRDLTILKQLTAAFPEDGIVTARTVEIRDLNTVTCTGTTRDHQSLLLVLERLRKTGNITDLKVDQIRGTKPPLQFTFNFHWNEGGRSAN